MSKHGQYQISLKAVMKNRQGKTLILQANPQGSWAGFFDLPGGRMHEHEFDAPFMDVLAREIREEIGDAVRFRLNPKPIALARYRNVAKGVNVLYVFFNAKYLSGKISLSHEHIGLEWVDLAKLNIDAYFPSGFVEGMRSLV